VIIQFFNKYSQYYVENFLNQACAWYTEIVLRKMWLYVCMYNIICLSLHTHVSKALEAKSSLYTRNKSYTEPV